MHNFLYESNLSGSLAATTGRYDLMIPFGFAKSFESSGKFSPMANEAFSRFPSQIAPSRSPVVCKDLEGMAVGSATCELLWLLSLYKKSSTSLKVSSLDLNLPSIKEFWAEENSDLES